MRYIQTQVLVIGGGATGTGVLRDLAMRGFEAILVDKSDLAHGTTGRYHGLLHSGGRYVVKDPRAAKECIEENRILRRILPHCIEDTGGFFVVTPWDDPVYISQFLSGCQKVDIPVEEIPIARMLREEPLLNPKISHCFRVPDASADSFLAAEANVTAAVSYGARVIPYHKVTNLLIHENRVIGARCTDLTDDETIEIQAEMIVNASGAWAGQISAMAGIEVNIVAGKGTMLAMNHRIVNTVINRCKIPSDGDILVPAHTVAVIGTTDVKVADPDHYPIEPWEVHLMLEEGDKLVPGFKEMRMLRAWAGVRPLYQESRVSDTRDVTRAFVLLDHEVRDSTAGLITITSGKWTTYRKMAEITVDLVCQKLNLDRPCRTHLETLPSPEHGHHFLGARLEKVEKERGYGKLVCECELVSYDEIIKSLTDGKAITIDDIRRDTRLGMGPCQGGFCTYRVAGILHKFRQPPVEKTNLALRDFLQERWKGLLPVLWGQQVRQERLDELIYLSLFNTDHLPGPQYWQLSPTLYDAPTSPLSESSVSTSSDGGNDTPDLSVEFISESRVKPRTTIDVLIVGAGLAGLSCAWAAASRDKRVRVISKGWGALYWHAGCVDVVGYYPLDHEQPIDNPGEHIMRMIETNPDHPYALLGIDALADALNAFREFCKVSGYPLHGALDQNWLLPSALGALRPTCLAPEMMIAGDMRQNDPMIIIGFDSFVDFYPQLIASNLTAQGVPAAGISLDLPALQSRNSVTSRDLAHLFEMEEFRAQLIASIRKELSNRPELMPSRIGFPAVLGLKNPIYIKDELEIQLQLPVFEIPTLPPSIPGIRLSNLLVSAIEDVGGHVFDGMEVTRADFEDSQLITLWSEAAARQKPNRAANFVLATGGILGGGIVAEYSGYLHEAIFDLPVHSNGNRNSWFQRQFLSASPHPIYTTGINIDHNFKPTDPEGHMIFDNLYAIGTSLRGGDYIRERSFDGIGLGTGYHLGASI